MHKWFLNWLNARGLFTASQYARALEDHSAVIPLIHKIVDACITKAVWYFSVCPLVLIFTIVIADGVKELISGEGFLPRPKQYGPTPEMVSDGGECQTWAFKPSNSTRVIYSLRCGQDKVVTTEIVTRGSGRNRSHEIEQITTN